MHSFALWRKGFEPVRETSDHSFSRLNMIGWNQPQQDPVAVSLATDAAGSNKKHGKGGGSREQGQNETIHQEVCRQSK